jgi:hypothetical protein
MATKDCNEGYHEESREGVDELHKARGGVGADEFQHEANGDEHLDDTENEPDDANQNRFEGAPGFAVHLAVLSDGGAGCYILCGHGISLLMLGSTTLYACFQWKSNIGTDATENN